MSTTPETPDTQDQPELESQDAVIDVEATTASPMPGVEHRQVALRDDAWKPSPLSVLSDEEFDRRLALMSTERKRIQKIQLNLMKEDVDYGVIEGTDKRALYQAGAEILNKVARLRPRYEVHRYAGDGETAPHIRYEVRCELVDENDRVVCEGMGSANSWEKKHRYRNAARVCPECGKDSIIKGKAEYGGGYVCWARRDGCGAKFTEDDPRIADQAVGLLENPDPHDLDNTLVQMAAKRAYVKTTRTAHAVSGIFTQDPDDDTDANLTKDAQQQQPAKGKAKDGKPKNGAKITPQAIDKIREKAREIAPQFGDESITEAVIIQDVLRHHSVDALEDLQQNDLPNMLAAIFKWQPGGGE